jgi:hypothetical protein
LLHEIIVSAGCEIKIALRDFHGRPDAYVINGEVGLLIKHSKSRLTPWIFTFAKEHVAELFSLRQSTKVCFVGLVCDEDGFVCVRDSELVGVLTPTECEAASVRVDRGARKMYRLSSSGNELDGKIAKGAEEIVAEIRKRSIGYVLPSSET